MGSLAWTLLGGGFAALMGFAQYVLRLRFLWKVYDRGGREDLAVAGRVTTSPIEALRRKCGGHHDPSISVGRVGVEEPG